MDDLSLVADNIASVRGGGIFASVALAPDSSPDLITLRGSSGILANQASSGGGLFLQGWGTRPHPPTLRMQETSFVAGNIASGAGGGVALDHARGILEDSAAVTGNVADTVGGGISITFLSNVEVFDLVQVSSNIAGVSGGGVYLAGFADLVVTGTPVTWDPALLTNAWSTPNLIVPPIGAVRILNNSALGGNGGGIYSTSFVQGVQDSIAKVDATGLIIAGNSAACELNVGGQCVSGTGMGGGIYANDPLEDDEICGLGYEGGVCILGAEVGPSGAVNLKNTLVLNNAARGGAGVYLIGRELDFDLVTSTTSVSPCDPASYNSAAGLLTFNIDTDRYCSEIAGNEAVGSGSDDVGGIAVLDGAVARLTRVGISLNASAPGSGAPSALVIGGLAAPAPPPGFVPTRDVAAALTNVQAFQQLGTEPDAARIDLGNLAINQSTLVEGGQLWHAAGGATTLRRSVAWDAVAGLLGAILQVDPGASFVATQSIGTGMIGASNLAADPLFDPLAPARRGQARLLATSPGIDFVTGATLEDGDTVCRTGVRGDAGAFENPQGLTCIVPP